MIQTKLVNLSILFSIFLIAHSSQGSILADSSDNSAQEHLAHSANHLVRVRLASQEPSIQISGWNLRLKKQSADLKPIRTRLQIQRTFGPSGPEWKLTWELGNSPAQTQRLVQSRFEVFGERLQRGPKSLPSHLVFSNENQKIDMVALLPIENYLVGVISSEMPLKWPIEALKAQTIAARSYTLATAKERKSRHYDVDSTISDQVFNHISQEMDSDPLIQKAKEAVLTTRGLVLSTQRGTVLKSYYHSDCGGQTSSEKSVWGYGHSGPIIVDSYCQNSPRSKWVYEISKNQLYQKIKDRLGFVASLTEIIPVRSAKSVRAEKLSFRSAQGEIKELSAHEVRARLGYSNLKSTVFEVEKKSENLFSFNGQGWGHGVGLCQWGSRRMAEIGKTHDQIIGHYYPLAVIRRKLL